jgi:hypothetical protein
MAIQRWAFYCALPPALLEVQRESESGFIGILNIRHSAFNLSPKPLHAAPFPLCPRAGFED